MLGLKTLLEVLPNGVCRASSKNLVEEASDGRVAEKLVSAGPLIVIPRQQAPVTVDAFPCVVYSVVSDCEFSRVTQGLTS